MDNYPNKTVMEMHSEKLCRQVGVAGDMLPGDTLDNLLRTWTGFLIETLFETASLTNPKNGSNY